MDRESFLRLMVDQDVNEDTYRLDDTNDDDRYSVHRSGPGWRLTYSERGTNCLDVLYMDESAALSALAEKLLRDRGTRNSWRKRPPPPR